MIDRIFNNSKTFYLALLVFILVFYLFVQVLLVPDIQTYIKTKEQYRLQQFRLKSIRQNTQDTMMQLQMQNKLVPYLERMKDRYDKQRLLRIFSSFGIVKKIELIGDVDKKVRKRLYLIEMKIDTPKSFFQMLTSIQKSSYPFEIEYPVVFTKEKKRIIVTFYLDLYTLGS